MSVTFLRFAGGRTVIRLIWDRTPGLWESWGEHAKNCGGDTERGPQLCTLSLFLTILLKCSVFWNSFIPHMRHHLVWVSRRTGQEQCKDNHNSRKKKWHVVHSGTYISPANGQETSQQTSHVPETVESNLCPQVGTLDHRMPKQPDTRTVSSHRASHQSTLNYHHLKICRVCVNTKKIFQ